jgi:hypothetical protein
MQMNAPTCPEALLATDQRKQPGGNPGMDTLVPKARLHAQAQIRNPAWADDPVEDAFGTFIGGDGI